MTPSGEQFDLVVIGAGYQGDDLCVPFARLGHPAHGLSHGEECLRVAA